MFSLQSKGPHYIDHIWKLKKCVKYILARGVLEKRAEYTYSPFLPANKTYMV
jgi:hypothetical protein